MPAETVRTSIDIPRDLHCRLREKAARLGCSARRLILDCIEQALDTPEPVRPRQRLSLEEPIVPSRGKPFALTSEEIHELIDHP